MMKQINGIKETARLANTLGYRNKQHELIQVKALVQDCIKLGKIIHASLVYPNLFWAINWQGFETWLSTLSIANQTVKYTQR